MDLKASPSLASLYRNVTSYVDAPDEPGKKLSDYVQGENAIGSLGSGSDCKPSDTSLDGEQESDSPPLVTVFLQHLGIAASDLSFRPGRKDPVYHYHSIYDSEYWMETYGDPTFKRHAAVAKVLGMATMRFADSPVLPISVSDYAHELKKYSKDLQTKAHDTTPEEGDFDKLDFKALDGTIAKVASAADALHEEIKKVSSISCPRQRYSAIRSINQRLAKFESAFLDEGGLSRSGPIFCKNLR